MKYIMFLLPWMSFAQGFISTGIDARNAVFGSEVNEAAYDGILNAGFRSDDFQIQASYENFKAIDFYSFGIKSGMVLNHKGNVNYLPLLGISYIQRNVTWTKRLNVSVSLSAQIEYHIQRVFFYIRNEGRYRGDLKQIVFSGYVGMGVDIFK